MQFIGITKLNQTDFLHKRFFYTTYILDNTHKIFLTLCQYILLNWCICYTYILCISIRLLNKQN